MSNALCGLGLEARSSQGLEGGVSNLIYMAGYILPEGMSTYDKSKEFSNLEDAHLVFDTAEDNTMVLRDAHLMLGLRDSGTKAAEIGQYVKSLCRWHAKGMMQPLESAAWREIPVAYIHATSDLLIPIAEQQKMVGSVEKALENTGRKVQTFSGVWPLPPFHRGAETCRCHQQGCVSHGLRTIGQNCPSGVPTDL